MIQAVISQGHTEEDFARLLDLQAQVSGLDIAPEDAHVSDGLGEIAETVEAATGPRP
jgi:hypothetical protein